MKVLLGAVAASYRPRRSRGKRGRPAKNPAQSLGETIGVGHIPIGDDVDVTIDLV
jgi:hypothetical protein